jgi:transcriptional regulator with XRE-family HTH domain
MNIAPHAGLRDLISQMGISQAEAAKRLGISLRQMQSYLADPEHVSTAIAAPPYIALALERLAEKQRKLP